MINNILNKASKSYNKEYKKCNINIFWLFIIALKEKLWIINKINEKDGKQEIQILTRFSKKKEIK